MNNIETLLLTTESYPLGHTAEEAFVVPEIEAAITAGMRVIVVPTVSRGPVCPEFNRLEGAILCRDVCDSAFMRRKPLRPLLAPATLAHFRTAALDDPRYALAAEAVRRGLKAIVRRYSLTPANCVAEAFWFDFQSAALTSLGLTAAVRAHRYEIESRRGRRLRALTIARSAGLHAVSNAGAALLRERYPANADKISASPLGTGTDVAVSTPRDLAATRTVSFITIAGATDRKRPGLCIEMTGWLARSRPGWQVSWTLIGDGPALEPLRQAAANAMSLYPNLRIHLPGAMPHAGAMQALDTGAYDFALLLSASEGIPVSLMECMARGIPAVATDVGGTSEIVNDDTGILLPPDTDPEMFVAGLLPYLDNHLRYKCLCAAARNHILTGYSADRLRRQFISHLTRS